MKLFAVYVGGDIAGANIELHDMRFVVAPSIEESHSELRRQWWGTPSSLHIDCWAEVSAADGYRVSLQPEPFAGEERLYYVNLGGYEAGGSMELHRNFFVVATSEGKAKTRALKLGAGLIELHRDDIYEAEQAICLSHHGGSDRLFVHLIPEDACTSPTFFCEYIPIKRRKVGSTL
jgi:hypothetical protein